MKQRLQPQVGRSMANPLLAPADVKPHRPDFEVIGVFNAGVARVGEEIVLMLRVAERPIGRDGGVYLCPVYDAAAGRLEVREVPMGLPGYDYSDSREIRTPEGLLLTSISHLRAARSKDGIRFTVDEEPALFPANEYETYGIEDCRITEIDGVYYLNYSACSPLGITTYLATTNNFVTYERLGVMFHPDNKDVTIFPEKIGGAYYALHRPSASRFARPEMWLAKSPDLLCWGDHRHVMGCREGRWDEERLGASAVPLRIPQGWLEIYHGADRDNRYCAGAVLFDADEPWRIVARSEWPLLEPQEHYEKEGFFGNVVFPCGALCEDGIVKIYYGAADTFIAYAEIRLEEILDHLGLL